MERQCRKDTESSKYNIEIHNSHIDTLVIGDGNIVNNFFHTPLNADISTPPIKAGMTATQDGGESRKRCVTKQKQSKIRFPQRKFRPEVKAFVKKEREEDVDVAIIPQVFPNISEHGDRENARSLNKFFVVLNKLHPARDSGNWQQFDNAAESVLMENNGDQQVKILISLEKSVVQCYHNKIEEAEGMVLEALQSLQESKVKEKDVTGYHFLVAMAHCHLTGFYRRLNKHGKAEEAIGIGDQNSNSSSYLKALMYYEMGSNWMKYISSIPNSPARDRLVACVKDLMEQCITLCTELDNDGSVYIRKHHFALIKLALMSLNCRTRVAREQILTQRCIDDAKKYLKRVEERYEAHIREAPGQRIQLLVAMSDLAFRQKNYQVAHEYCVSALALAESGFKLEIKGIKDRLEDISKLMGKERMRDSLEIHSSEERHADSLSSSTPSSKKNSPCSSGCEMEVV